MKKPWYGGSSSTLDLPGVCLIDVDPSSAVIRQTYNSKRDPPGFSVS
jgi:hypothetical protein